MSDCCVCVFCSTLHIYILHNTFVICTFFCTSLRCISNVWKTAYFQGLSQEPCFADFPLFCLCNHPLQRCVSHCTCIFLHFFKYGTQLFQSKNLFCLNSLSCVDSSLRIQIHVSLLLQSIKLLKGRQRRMYNKHFYFSCWLNV